MTAQLSVEARHLLKLLDDGQWHQFTDIHARLSAAIAPGKALRRFDTVTRNWESRHGPRRGPEPPDDQKIASGQRSIAGDVINSMKKRYVEFAEATDGERRIRRRSQPVPIGGTAETVDAPPPDIPLPMPVAAVAQGGDHAMAFFSEQAIRAIVRDEIGLAFDRFQHGLQSWLGIKFADIERRRRVPKGSVNGRGGG